MYFAKLKMPKQSSCHIKGTVVLCLVWTSVNIILSGRSKIGAYIMDGNIAQFEHGKNHDIGINGLNTCCLVFCDTSCTR